MNTYYQHYEKQWRSESDDRITWAAQRLVLANGIVFAAQLVLNIPLGISAAAPPGGFLTHWLAFQPSSFIAGAVWQPLTYMFLHGGLMHLFMNMLWLFFFGPDVERALGTRQFIRFYVFCGTLSVLATFVPAVLLEHSESVVGASGAIMGVMVAYAIVSPDRQFFLFPLPVPINARTLVIIVIAMNILTALQGGGNTSVATHLGGMAAGFAYMKLLPMLRGWQRAHKNDSPRKKTPPKNNNDPDGNIGEAVDNIFKFKDKKR